MPSLQQRYYDLLVDRIRADQYPSHQLLDRLEASFWTTEQVVDYVELLLDKVNECHYPSHQLLDRIERMLILTANTA